MAYGDGYAGGYAGFTGYAVTVEVAFTTDPGDTPVWTDISAYLLGFSVNRGRQRELDTFQAGRLQVTLSNEDRRFDPTYAAGPYWPDVVPMRRIRVRAAWDGVTYDVFAGYVDGWDQHYDPPQAATCAVQATDAFKVLSNIELPNSVYALEVAADAPTHWWRLGEPSGSTVAFDAASSSMDGTYEGGVGLGAAGAPTHDPDGAATFDGVDDYVSFGAGPLITGTTYTVELWLKIAERTTTGWYTFFSQSQNNNTLTNSQPWGVVTGTDLGDPGKIRWDDTESTVRVDDDAWHHVVLTANAGSQTLYIDGFPNDFGTATSAGTGASEVLVGYPANASGAVAISRHHWPGSIDEVAIWATTAVGASRVLAHYNGGTAPWRNDTPGLRLERILDAAGWPDDERDFEQEDGLSVLQSADLGGSVLAVLQAVERTEFGALFITAAGAVRFIPRDDLLRAPYTTVQATFGDTGSDLEYGDLTYVYDDQLIWNEVRVSRSEGTVQVASDATSQTRYLRRSRVIEGLLHQDDSVSRDLASWVLGHYKDPILRVVGLRLEPSAGNEDTHFPQVLGRELMDRVAVNRTPQNLGVAIEQETRIEGITHTVTGVEWVTTWNLSPAETLTYWILGVAGSSELGETTRLGV